MSQTITGPLRRCEIRVIGNNNIPVEGADISFALNGTPAGLVKNSRGYASILIPPNYGKLEITATSQSISETIVLTPTTSQATIVLKTPGAIIKALLPSTPTCPDGTTNQPCVNCVINGTPVQICA